MPNAKNPPAWGQVLAAAGRLDAGRGGTRYSRAVILAMLARVVEQLPPPPPPRLVFIRKKPPVLSPAQQHAAWRRKMANNF